MGAISGQAKDKSTVRSFYNIVLISSSLCTKTSLIYLAGKIPNVRWSNLIAYSVNPVPSCPNDRVILLRQNTTFLFLLKPSLSITPPIKAVLECKTNS